MNYTRFHYGCRICRITVTVTTDTPITTTGETSPFTTAIGSSTALVGGVVGGVLGAVIVLLLIAFVVVLFIHCKQKEYTGQLINIYLGG